MAVRTSEAEWRGNLREGAGKVKLGSGAFEGSYSFPSRFEDGKGTNPEELLGASHAACYSMALSAGLAKAGHPPTRDSWWSPPQKLKSLPPPEPAAPTSTFPPPLAFCTSVFAMGSNRCINST